VIQTATASATPVGPQTRRSIEIAVVIALLLAFGAVLLAENSDRRIRTPEDLERLTNWPLLGVIPSSAFVPDKQTPREQEALQMLGTTLTYFNVDRKLSSAPSPKNVTLISAMANSTPASGTIRAWSVSMEQWPRLRRRSMRRRLARRTA